VGFLFIHWLPAIIAFFLLLYYMSEPEYSKTEEDYFFNTNDDKYYKSYSIVWVLTFIFAYILIPVFF